MFVYELPTLLKNEKVYEEQFCGTGYDAALCQG